MSVVFVPRASGPAHRAGFLVVLGLHALLALALLNGLGRSIVSSLVPPPVALLPPQVPKTVEEPPAPLPKPRNIVLPRLLSDPPPILDAPRNPEPTITTSREPAAQEPASAGDPAGTGTAAVPLAPRPAPALAARPTLGDVRACAPTADDYPITARRAEAAGTTRLRFAVGADGALLRSEVVRSAGPSREHKLLDRMAESKLAGCRFVPGQDASGQPIGGSFEVDYVWRLEN